MQLPIHFHARLPVDISPVPQAEGHLAATRLRRVASAGDIALGRVDKYGPGRNRVAAPTFVAIFDAKKQEVAHAADLGTKRRRHALVCHQKAIQRSFSIRRLSQTPVRRVADVAEQSRRGRWRRWELLVDHKGVVTAAREAFVARTGHLTALVVDRKGAARCDGVATFALDSVLETEQEVVATQVGTRMGRHVVLVFEESLRQGVARRGALEPTSKGVADWHVRDLGGNYVATAKCRLGVLFGGGGCRGCGG